MQALRVPPKFHTPVWDDDNPMERKNTEENRDSHDASTANQLKNNSDAFEKRGSD
jgi:hypothetical protein